MEALKINWFLEAIRHTCMWKSSQGTEFNKLIHHAHADKGEKLILALKRDPYLGFINGKKESYCNSKCPAREWSKTNKRQSLLALELIRWGPFEDYISKPLAFERRAAARKKKIVQTQFDREENEGLQQLNISMVDFISFVAPNSSMSN